MSPDWLLPFRRGLEGRKMPLGQGGALPSWQEVLVGSGERPHLYLGSLPCEAICFL